MRGEVEFRNLDREYAKEVPELKEVDIAIQGSRITK